MRRKIVSELPRLDACANGDDASRADLNIVRCRRSGRGLLWWRAAAANHDRQLLLRDIHRRDRQLPILGERGQFGEERYIAIT
jgi:hypothetical protein